MSKRKPEMTEEQKEARRKWFEQHVIVDAPSPLADKIREKLKQGFVDPKARN